MGDGATYPYQVDKLPNNTCIWILTNKKSEAKELFGKMEAEQAIPPI